MKQRCKPFLNRCQRPGGSPGGAPEDAGGAAQAGAGGNSVLSGPAGSPFAADRAPPPLGAAAAVGICWYGLRGRSWFVCTATGDPSLALGLTVTGCGSSWAKPEPLTIAARSMLVTAVKPRCVVNIGCFPRHLGEWPAARFGTRY